jgi:hypothetical protein
MSDPETPQAPPVQNPCGKQGQRPISRLIIYLPEGIDPVVLHFRPHNKEGPVADDTVPMFVRFGSAILDPRDPLMMGRDAIC